MHLHARARLLGAHALVMIQYDGFTQYYAVKLKRFKAVLTQYGFTDYGTETGFKTVHTAAPL